MHSPANHVIHGVYGVSASYDVVDNKQENKTTYSFEGKCDNVTITQINESADQKTVRNYNDKGLLRQEEITPINKISPRSTTTYEYSENDKPKKVSVSDDGIYYSTGYSYENNYPDRLTSETTRRNCRVDYTYHTVNRHTTNKVKTATYYSKSDTKFVEDYIISTELTADGKSIEYERVTKNNVLQSQTKYEYDSEGNVSAVKRWTKDTNGDGVLDENDEFITTSSTHELTANNTRQITNCIANVKNADGINEGNVVTEYKMNVYGAPTYQKDSYGTETTIEYDTLNRPVKYNLPNGSSTTVEYVIDANKKNSYTIATDAAGIQYKNLYDGIGRIKAKYRLNGSSWEMLEGYAYDTAGRLSEKEYGQNGAERVKEVYTYDSLNRVSTKKVYENRYTLMYTETYKYSQGTVTKSTVGADGTQKADEVTKYDSSGNILESGLKSGDETIMSVFEYDYLNRKTKETDPNGNSTTYEYDCLGNLLKTTNALGHSVSAQYDLAGRAISSTDPKGNTTVTDYDKLGRAIQVTAPFDDSQNAITKTYYDKNSNVVKKSVRKNGNKYYFNQYKYDNMGNLIAEILGESDERSVVQYSYDAANRITKMITGLSVYKENPTLGYVTQYEYDNVGRIKKITDPMGETDEFIDYDVYGNVTMKEDRNNNFYQYNYGIYGVKTLNVVLGPQNKTTYNGIGQVVATSSKNQNGETVEESYTYDQFGRIATKTSNDGTVQSYTYDKNSNVLTYKMDKDGETKNDISYTYNSLNRLTKFDNGDMMFTYVYDANENLFVVLNNKTFDYNYMFTYNKANLPTKIEMDYEKNSYNYTMSYWTNGQKYLEQDTVNDTWTEYNYNSLGQLTLEHKMKGLETISELKYTYDSSGNRTQMQSFNEDITKWDVVTDYTYDANNRMTSATRSVLGDVTNTAQYYYDRNGNTLAEQNKTYTMSGEESSDMALSGRVGSSTTKVYTYDRLNRLMQYNDGSTEAVYTYGVDNLRASKKVNGEKTEFVWNGQNLAGETTDGISTIYNYDVTGIAGYKKDNEEEVRYIKDPHENFIDMQQE
ncbi:MAG: RHS repeat protein [Clostridia bacterium]|nr:RHS repeat protein [Clostridia bacterium]